MVKLDHLPLNYQNRIEKNEHNILLFYLGRFRNKGFLKKIVSRILFLKTKYEINHFYCFW